MKKKTKIAWRYIKHLIGWFVRASWILNQDKQFFLFFMWIIYEYTSFFIVRLSFWRKRLRFFLDPIVEVIALLYFGKWFILLWFSCALPIFLMILCQNMKFKWFSWNLIPRLNEFVKSDCFQVTLKFLFVLTSEVESWFWNLLTDKIEHRFQIVVRNRKFSLYRLSKFFKFLFS